MGLLGILKANPNVTQDMRDTRGDVLMGLGTLMSQVGAGQAPNISPIMQSLDARKQSAQMRKVLDTPGMMDGFTPQQRAILAQMPEGMAVEMIMQNAFQPPPEPVRGVALGNDLVNPVTGEVIYQGSAAQNLPDGYESRRLTALAGGLVEGTPEFQAFMIGSEEGNEYGLSVMWGRDQAGNPVPLQVSKNGTAIATQIPEGVTPDPALSAQMQAEGRAIGMAKGEGVAAAPIQIDNADIALQGVDALRSSPALDAGTGMSSLLSGVPGTMSYGFRVQTEQLKGGAFLTAIQQLQGMGALSNTEGQTATTAIARLDAAQTKEDFLKALDDYEAIVKRGRDRATGRLESAGIAPPAPMRDDDGPGKFRADIERLAKENGVPVQGIIDALPPEERAYLEQGAP